MSVIILLKLSVMFYLCFIYTCTWKLWWQIITIRNICKLCIIIITNTLLITRQNILITFIQNLRKRINNKNLYLEGYTNTTKEFRKCSLQNTKALLHLMTLPLNAKRKSVTLLKFCKDIYRWQKEKQKFLMKWPDACICWNAHRYTENTSLYSELVINMKHSLICSKVKKHGDGINLWCCICRLTYLKYTTLPLDSPELSRFSRSSSSMPGASTSTLLNTSNRSSTSPTSPCSITNTMTWKETTWRQLTTESRQIHTYDRLLIL